MDVPTALYYRILRYQPENLERLRREFHLIELDDPTQDTAEILRDAVVLFAPLGYFVNSAKMNACPRLRVIASNTTGHPHIDVDEAHARGIAVACLKFAPEFLRGITPTAELTWGLIIALTRRVVPAHQAAVSGNWDRRPFGAPAMLSRMSLGIAGLGRLGSLVARYGLAFGMKVSYFDPHVEHTESSVRRLPSLEDLVQTNDIVSIHVPHEPATEGMFSQRIFSLFRRGGYLVNTARGELIDWSALLDGLQSGHLGGAALDVFQDEFRPGFVERFGQHPVLEYARTHDNLLLTPHIGGSTLDAWRMTEAHTIDMVQAALREAKSEEIPRP